MRSRLKQPGDTHPETLRAESFDGRSREELDDGRVETAEDTGARARGVGGHSCSARHRPQGLLAGGAIQ
jgi:hypothetical protein